jgi:hypothetical protein
MAQASATYTILSINPHTVLDANNNPVEVYRVLCETTHGDKFTVDAPRAGFSRERIKPLIEASAREFIALRQGA